MVFSLNTSLMAAILPPMLVSGFIRPLQDSLFRVKDAGKMKRPLGLFLHINGDPKGIGSCIHELDPSDRMLRKPRQFAPSELVEREPSDNVGGLDLGVGGSGR